MTPVLADAVPGLLPTNGPLGIMLDTTTLTHNDKKSVTRPSLTCVRDVAIVRPLQAKFITETDAAFAGPGP
ncbi:hypothetical protein D0T12_21195 [Actinomadura spongiicola]|uniref:Uncharacterized protein n=1 Tax=Actinomadura spongiicola TaxID=2303421 RepID=A0A372GDV5_9ACTN|nr:hypothetical protein [Actinomadura spongiicola]RFS83554.1 hypothetical protein D0T12_21195 [Actinomadura spongiicola]